MTQLTATDDDNGRCASVPTIEEISLQSYEFHFEHFTGNEWKRFQLIIIKWWNPFNMWLFAHKAWNSLCTKCVYVCVCVRDKPSQAECNFKIETYRQRSRRTLAAHLILNNFVKYQLIVWKPNAETAVREKDRNDAAGMSQKGRAIDTMVSVYFAPATSYFVCVLRHCKSSAQRLL